MEGIAFFHLLWLSLVPIGAAFLGKALVSGRRRGAGLVTGVVLLALSSPAVLFCLQMWPLDFLGSAREVRVSAGGRGYTVAMVQEPGTDFYDSYLEICRADGKTTRLMVDYDASKWWGLRTRVAGTRTDFVTWTGETVGSVDFADGTLSGSIDHKPYRFDELDFGRKWSNGG
jgi:hypothetical protein